MPETLDPLPYLSYLNFRYTAAEHDARNANYDFAPRSDAIDSSPALRRLLATGSEQGGILLSITGCEYPWPPHAPNVDVAALVIEAVGPCAALRARGSAAGDVQLQWTAADGGAVTAEILDGRIRLSNVLTVDASEAGQLIQRALGLPGLDRYASTSSAEVTPAAWCRA